MLQADFDPEPTIVRIRRCGYVFAMQGSRLPPARDQSPIRLTARAATFDGSNCAGGTAKLSSSASERATLRFAIGATYGVPSLSLRFKGK